MEFLIRPKDKCPCGSGKEYRKCHNPNRDKRDTNLWKGPGHAQSIMLGNTQPFDTIFYEPERKGEIKLGKDDDRFPLARFACVDDTVLTCEGLVRSLSVSVENGKMMFRGSIEIRGNVQHSVPVLIGSTDINSEDHCVANLSGSHISCEKGNWILFIGENENPMARLRKRPKWFRYLCTSGFLVELPSTGEMDFCLSSRSKGFNLFTVALPFAEIEIPHPQILVGGPQTTCQLELERENVYWDLMLSQGVFGEENRSRKDSKVFLGYDRGNRIEFDGFDRNSRKHFSNPRKLKIGISVPELSDTIGIFADVMEKTLRAISENGGFNFDEKGDKILESDFRDHVLTVLKSMGHFAFAEPSRRQGFIDILLRKNDLEAIIEFKVWGRRKYKEVIHQALGYGTPWTTEYATVMINPNSNSVIDKFIGNAKNTPGYRHLTTDGLEFAPLNKLTSFHYLASWNRHVAVTHFVINARFFNNNT